MFFKCASLIIRGFLVTTTLSPFCNANLRNASADKKASDDSITTAIFEVGEITSGRENSGRLRFGEPGGDAGEHARRKLRERLAGSHQAEIDVGL